MMRQLPQRLTSHSPFSHRGTETQRLNRAKAFAVVRLWSVSFLKGFFWYDFSPVSVPLWLTHLPAPKKIDRDSC